MKTDCVEAHINYWILKSTDGNDDYDKVQRIGLTNGKDHQVHLINNLFQQGISEKPIICGLNDYENILDKKTLAIKAILYNRNGYDTFNIYSGANISWTMKGI